MERDEDRARDIHPTRHQGAHQASPVAHRSSDYATPAETQATQDDVEYHDALSDAARPSAGTSLAKDTEEQVTHATPLQDTRDETAQREPDQEEQLKRGVSPEHIDGSLSDAPTPSKIASDSGIDVPQLGIVTSTADKEEEQATPAKPRDEAKAEDAIVASTPGNEEERANTVKPRDKTEAEDAIVVSATKDVDEHVVRVNMHEGTESEDAASDEDAEEFTVSRVTAHRIDPKTDDIELLVHWDGADASWEPEEQLQPGALEAVTAYWDTVDGGRLSVRPYEVYAIKGHKRLKKGRAKTGSLYLEVEWLGYKDTSMEPLRRFAKDQPELVEEYFESIGGRPE